MGNQHDYVAFFDLDKTILRVNSGEYLVRQAYRTGLMSTRDVLKGIYLAIMYKLGLKNTLRIIEDMAAWISGMSEQKISELTNHVFNTYLIDLIRPEIYKEIKFHKHNNAEVVILSATMPAICKLFAEHLGFERFICTDLEISEGMYTGKPKGAFCFGDEKRIRLEQFCQQHSYSTDAAYYYSDEYSDFNALNAVGHPRCVQPDSKLRKMANENKWPIFDW